MSNDDATLGSRIAPPTLKALRLKQLPNWLKEKIIPNSSKNLPIENSKQKVVRKRLTEQEQVEWETWKIGKDSEDRFHKLNLQLVKILRELAPKNVISIECKKSRRHDPINGQFDLDDKRGMDEKLTFKIRLWKGRIRKYTLAWDVKSSQYYVDRCNRKNNFYPLPRGVDFKNAILVHHRPEQKIIAEELNDIHLILPKTIFFDPKKVLSHFSSV